MRRAANGLKRLVAAQLSEQLANDLRHLFLDGGSVEFSAGSSHAFLCPKHSSGTIAGPAHCVGRSGRGVSGRAQANTPPRQGSTVSPGHGLKGTSGPCSSCQSEWRPREEDPGWAGVNFANNLSALRSRRMHRRLLISAEPQDCGSLELPTYRTCS